MDGLRREQSISGSGTFQVQAEPSGFGSGTCQAGFRKPFWVYRLVAASVSETSEKLLDLLARQYLEILKQEAGVITS